MADIRNNTSLCKGCQKPIVWVEDLDGKRIPLDIRPPIYSYALIGSKMVAQRMRGMVGITHFATCPNAVEFSSSKKKKAESR